jgi:hypothetical protein
VTCAILVDRRALPAWKRECIEILRGRYNVRVVRLGESAAPFAARIFRWALGGKMLREGALRTEPDFGNGADLVVDLRAKCAPAPRTRARFGHWFFCDGNGRRLGELPGAAEISNGSATFTIELRSCDGHGAVSVLRRGRFKSLYAYARSMDVALRECKRWPAICLAVADAQGEPTASPAPPPGEKRRIAYAGLLIHLARAFVYQCYNYLFVDARWKVGIVRDTPASFLSKSYRPSIEWLSAGRDFFADPFVVQLNGRPFIMGEALDVATQTGFIRGVTIGDDGGVATERTIMRSATHLSYPYVFQSDGQWYLVPESAAESRVSLYRAVEFPYAWERVATLIEGVAACDSTIIRHDGLWWLFCTDRSRDANLNLFAYYAKDLFGPWLPHTANPVKTDIRSSRPAGTPFSSNGNLYRPAQDCGESYGASISFNRIKRLTEHEYAEEEVSVFDHSHTISSSNGIVAIDSKSTVIAAPRLIGRRIGALAGRMLRMTHAS